MVAMIRGSEKVRLQYMLEEEHLLISLVQQAQDNKSFISNVESCGECDEKYK